MTTIGLFPVACCTFSMSQITLSRGLWSLGQVLSVQPLYCSWVTFRGGAAWARGDHRTINRKLKPYSYNMDQLTHLAFLDHLKFSCHNAICFSRGLESDSDLAIHSVEANRITPVNCTALLHRSMGNDHPNKHHKRRLYTHVPCQQCISYCMYVCTYCGCSLERPPLFLWELRLLWMHLNQHTYTHSDNWATISGTLEQLGVSI